MTWPVRQTQIIIKTQIEELVDYVRPAPRQIIEHLLSLSLPTDIESATYEEKQSGILSYTMKVSGVDPKEYNLRYMQETSSPTLGNNAFIVACFLGDIDMVNVLLKRSDVDPSYQENEPLKMACGFGHLDIVKMLVSLPGVDVTCDKNRALFMAAKRGHKDIVEYLLSFPGVDPYDNDAAAMKWARGEDIKRMLGSHPIVY